MKNQNLENLQGGDIIPITLYTSIGNDMRLFIYHEASPRFRYKFLEFIKLDQDHRKVKKSGEIVSHYLLKSDIITTARGLYCDYSIRQEAHSRGYSDTYFNKRLKLLKKSNKAK